VDGMTINHIASIDHGSYGNGLGMFHLTIGACHWWQVQPVVSRRRPRGHCKTRITVFFMVSPAKDKEKNQERGSKRVSLFLELLDS
jgi:hypothetical protein